MGFVSGTVSFSRFQILGGAPKRLDDNLLDKLRADLIGKHAIVQSNNEEVGWIGGRHILDREFDLEKNILLDCLHFGMRIDAAKIPPDLLRAYTQMELDALRREDSKGQPNAKMNARLKKQAIESAKRRADQEVKEGRYCRLRHFPMLLDTRNDILFAGATQPAVQERLHPLFKHTFGKRLEQMTVGYLAYEWAQEKGLSRKMEGLKPAEFVENPDSNGEIYWTAHDPASRDFLGNEFLLWLWYTLSEETDTVDLLDKTDVSVIIVKQLMLECPLAETGKEVITCDGPAQLPESRRAIKSGKLPRKAGLIVSRQGEQYEFTLQAETFNIASATLPKSEAMSATDGRGRVEERIEQIRHLCDTVDQLFYTFLQLRLSPAWQDVLGKMKGWLRKN